MASNEYDPAVRGPSELEVAAPETRVGVPAKVPVPVQVPSVKKAKLTVPVGAPAPMPVTLAWWVRTVPRGTDVTGDPPERMVVVVWLGAMVTVNGSQPPVEP